jgi:hypothetical protein
VLFILRVYRRLKFKITSIQFLIDQLIDKLAGSLAISRDQVLGLDVLDIGQRKFLQVVQEFVDGFFGLAFEVLKVDEHALLLALNTNVIRTMFN